MPNLINKRAQLAYKILTTPDHDGMHINTLAKRMGVDPRVAEAACADLRLAGLLNCVGPVAVSSAVYRSLCEIDVEEENGGNYGNEK